MVLKLSTLSLVLGLALVALNGFALFAPRAFSEKARQFPRSISLGTIMTLLATIWFVANVRKESIADFESLKPFLYSLFIAVGIGTCIFVRDFLGARGLALIFLLLAQLLVETARWAESDWRMIIAGFSYLLVFLGIWFTISPWRLRDLLHWLTRDNTRLRVASGLGLAFGLLVAALGVVVFK